MSARYFSKVPLADNKLAEEHSNSSSFQNKWLKISNTTNAFTQEDNAKEDNALVPTGRMAQFNFSSIPIHIARKKLSDEDSSEEWKERSDVEIPPKISDEAVSDDQAFRERANVEEPPKEREAEEAENAECAGSDFTCLSRKVLRAFLNGSILEMYNFGPLHPWTEKMREHPHMEQAREQVRLRVQRYCQVASGFLPPEKVSLAGASPFNLNDLSVFENLVWLSKDLANWISEGSFGQESAYLFGSYRLEWKVSIDKSALTKSQIDFTVDFNASDTLHLKSATRFPLTEYSPFEDAPYGQGLPFNNIHLHWNWVEALSTPFWSERASVEIPPPEKKQTASENQTFQERANVEEPPQQQ